MPLPPPLETATVQGTWISPITGDPLIGIVALRAVNEVRSPAGNVLVMGSPVKRVLVAGAAEWQNVLFSDSAGLSSPVIYQLAVPGYKPRFIEIIKAQAVDGVVQLADVVTLEEPPILVAYVLASTIGQPNGIPPLNADSEIPAEFLPAGSGGGVSSVDGRTGVVALGDLYVDPTELATGLAAKANTGHTHASGQITDFTTAVDARADARIAQVVDAAPAALDTLNELAAALGDDANFAATMTTALAGKQAADADLTAIAALSPADGSMLARVAGAWDSRTGAQVKTDLALNNVANLAPADLPVSTAAQAALDAKAPLASPAFTGTPTGITRAHVGLGAVDNTSDADKPISTATSVALSGKAALIHQHHFDRLLAAYEVIGLTGDPIAFGSSGFPGNQDHLIGLVTVTPGAEVAGVKVGNQNAGTYADTGVPAQARFYDFDGGLLGTSPHDPTLWLARGWRLALAATPFTAPANGLMFIGVSFGGFTDAQPACQSGNQASEVIAGLADGRRRSIFGQSGSGLPASFNPATYGGGTIWYPLMGVVAT